jgi:hypothetical protein
MKDGWLKRQLLKPLNNRRAIKTLQWIESCKYVGRRVWSHEGGNRIIREALASGEPQAIGRLGSTETLAIRTYLRTRGSAGAAARSASSRHQLYTHSGMYPDDYDVYARFCQHMLDEVLPKITLMAVWYNLGEASIVNQYCPGSTLLGLLALEPYRVASPWWGALAGRKVLAVHPFSDTILQQHARLSNVWAGTQVMPEFTLACVRVPHYPTMVPPRHRDWFETLAELKEKMAAKPFDIAIIGAGAYSLPLAVHAKKLGKQGIHLGGAAQLFFGIRGKRWDRQPEFQRIFNEYWVRPLPEDTPPDNISVEGGCYW